MFCYEMDLPPIRSDANYLTYEAGRVKVKYIIPDELSQYEADDDEKTLRLKLDAWGL